MWQLTHTYVFLLYKNRHEQIQIDEDAVFWGRELGASAAGGSGSGKGGSKGSKGSGKGGSKCSKGSGKGGSKSGTGSGKGGSKSSKGSGKGGSSR